MALTLTGTGQGGVFTLRGNTFGGSFTTSIAPPPLPPLLLDTYPGATNAYSLRKLRSAYTGSAIRVRRSSDNAEQNIGFTAAGTLDTTALTTFTAGIDGFVTTWYDQSGTGNNLRQTSAIAQPSIVNGGNLILRNGKPYIEALSAKFFQFLTDITTTAGNSFSFWITYEKDGTGNHAVLSNIGGNSYHWLDFGSLQYLSQNDTITISPVYGINTLYLSNAITNYSVSGTMYRNGVSIGARGALTVGTVSSWLFGGGRTAKITTSEFIFYPADKTADRTNIQSNINSYYSIY